MAAVWGAQCRLGCIGAGKMARGILQGAILTGTERPSGNSKRLQGRGSDQAGLELLIRLLEALSSEQPSGWADLGTVQAGDVTVSAPSDRNLKPFQEHGCHVTHVNGDVVLVCSVILLAVKPHIVPAVLKEISPLVTPEHVIISVAAGVTLRTLEEALPDGTKVLRMSPNLPCLVQEGAVVLCRGRCAGDREVAMLKSLFSGCGLSEEVPESYIDIHTGLSGSGVAYVYMFAEALADGAVKMGMSSELSHRIAAQTLLGAAKMLLETGEHPAKLRSDVCTPGGTTIHALHELEKGGLRATVMNAVEAATVKARNIGKPPPQ